MKKEMFLKAVAVFISAGCCLLSGQAKSQEQELYAIYSKDVGWSSIDMRITEVERREKSSLLAVTSFTQDAAREGKFLFCYVFRLAQQREFRLARWSKLPEAGDSVVVAFVASDYENLETILGQDMYDYSWYDHALDLESYEWKQLQKSCGF